MSLGPIHEGQIISLILDFVDDAFVSNILNGFVKKVKYKPPNESIEYIIFKQNNLLTLFVELKVQWNECCFYIITLALLSRSIRPIHMVAGIFSQVKAMIGSFVTHFHDGKKRDISIILCCMDHLRIGASIHSIGIFLSYHFGTKTLLHLFNSIFWNPKPILCQFNHISVQ